MHSHPHTVVECVSLLLAHTHTPCGHQNTLRLLLRRLLWLLVVVVLAHGDTDMVLPWCGTCSWHYCKVSTLI